MFFVVFLLFSVLIVQLGVVQILNGQEFQDKINSTVKDVTKIPVPRGKIYDRNHQVVVNNKALYSITYTPPKGVQAKDKLEVAEKLSKYISMYDSKTKKSKLKTITERDKKEYFYLLHQKEVDKRLSSKEAADMDNAKQYKTLLSRITKEEISHFSEEDMKVMLIKKEMDKAYSLTPQIIKNEGVTPEEYAKVSEHLHELPGVNATTDWERNYPYKNTFKNILGSITTEKQGVPSEKLKTYLAKGYNRNDRIGKSGLEEEYEDLLRGRKEQIQYTTNKKGEVVDTKTIVEGQRGSDLVLTIDMDFQKKLDKVVKDALQSTKGKFPYLNRFMNDAMAVAMNPKTGEILAISGTHYDEKKHKYENADYKVLYDARQPGSAVKGATLLSGYQSGVIDIGKGFYDAPIKIAGTPQKASWRNFGWVDDVRALRVSSNVYMFNVAMRMGGEYNYQPNKSITFHPEAITEFRNYFSEFGLGVKTGVDFPYEATGYKGDHPKAGNLLDFAIGQYDTFTTLQLAQYVSTIANDGYRVRPHFLKEVREPIADEEQLGPVKEEVNPTIMNKIQMDDKYLHRVQEGFRQVFHNPEGTAYNHFNSEPYRSYKIAGKTGTAQNYIFENGVKVADTENQTLIGYAPYDDPEIAFAIIVPDAGLKASNAINHTIGQGLLKSYFDLKKERAQDDTAE
ncbi:penicillin-binding protein 2 [Virgibacillus sp. 179-BFC.A HS]|uniref:serine-type D-Ala-D-Ala carboxypeptidase n=1 Tax=Tigheibacillus jepli TaxID=3035914 RepID=A0ABU5CGW0_9BACI|nr:penicillin-binding protein 2 [Virgibacillus sp. 179-BFC.A HS]MDY0405561.1 penicillin-binding protein 2 [Virgibacillus sp. 179-BFC.A HS]